MAPLEQQDVKKKEEFKIKNGEFEDSEEDDDDPLHRNQYDDDEESENPPSMNSSEGELFTPWEKVKIKKQRKARAFLIEMVTYIVFILVFCLTVFVMRSPWTYWSADTVRSTMRLDDNKGGFLAISSSAGFFEYMETNFVPTLFPVETYNGDDLSSYDKRFMATHNRVLGTARIRQVRVDKNRNCMVSTAFRGFVRDCYGEYSDSAMADDPFGPAYNRTKYHFSSTKQLCQLSSPSSKYCSSLIVGKTGTFYPSSGYVVDLPVKQDAALKVVRNLYDDGWVDAQTRAIMVDFTIFNANVQMFVIVQLLVEWLPTGSVVPKVSIRPTPTLKLDSHRARATLALEILLSIYLFCYFLNELTEFYSFFKVKKDRCAICRKKAIYQNGLPKEYQCLECGHTFDPFSHSRCKRCLMEYDATRHMCWRGYFQHLWNWLDIINLSFFVAVLGLRFDLRSDLSKIDWSGGEDFVLLYPLAGQYSTSNYLNSVNALLCFVKTFKYLGKFQNLAVLIRTLSNARSEIGYFLVIFAIIFTGFALAFQVGFGADVSDYSSFTDSVMSLFRMLLGEFDYNSLQNSNRVLAPIFFIFYNILVLFVLSNMFIAIVSGAYATAIAEQHTLDENYLSSALKLFFNEARAKFQRHFGGGSLVQLIFTLVDNLQKVRDLTRAEQDSLRAFKYDVELNPDERDMLLFILNKFDRKVDRQMDLEDFYTLKNAIAEYREFGSAGKAGLDADDTAQPPPPAPRSPKSPLHPHKGERAIPHVAIDTVGAKHTPTAANGYGLDNKGSAIQRVGSTLRPSQQSHASLSPHSPKVGLQRQQSHSAFFGSRAPQTSTSPAMHLSRQASHRESVDSHNGAFEVMNSKLRHLEESVNMINVNLASLLTSMKDNPQKASKGSPRAGANPSPRGSFRNPDGGGGAHPLRLSAHNLNVAGSGPVPPAAVARHGSQLPGNRSGRHSGNLQP